MVHVYYIYIVDAGTIVLLAISFLSPFFQYIPKSALSAIIIAAVLPMVDVRIVYRIFKIRGVYFCGCLCACIHGETRKVVKQCRWQTTQQHLRQPTFGIRTHDFLISINPDNRVTQTKCVFALSLYMCCLFMCLLDGRVTVCCCYHHSSG